jgi:hypothetical protein
MSAEIPAEALQLRSLVRADQTLELFLDVVPVPEPGPDEVLIRVEAAALNPSDMGLLFGGADMVDAVASGSADRPVVTAPIPDAAMRGLAGRVGTPMPVGNKGAGTVVAAGESAAAQALLGKVVAAAGGGMYSQYQEAMLRAAGAVHVCNSTSTDVMAGLIDALQARSPSKRSPTTAGRQPARSTSSSRAARAAPAGAGCRSACPIRLRRRSPDRRRTPERLAAGRCCDVGNDAAVDAARVQRCDLDRLPGWAREDGTDPAAGGHDAPARPVSPNSEAIAMLPALTPM